jgi:membrane protease YdiL (CAAX protease family)
VIALERPVRRSAAAWVPVTALVCAALLIRPLLSRPGLAALFSLLLAGSLAPACVRGERRISPVVALCAGIAALFAARLVAGTAFPVRTGAWGVELNALAAIAEEAFFRRYLFARLAQYGAAAAVLGTAAVFALVHLPAYGSAALPVDAGAGLLLSWQRWASGRWEVPAATHLAANLLVMW